MNTSTPRIFIAATRQNDGKTTTSLGLIAALQNKFPRVGYIKPVGQRFVEIEEQKIDEDTVLMEMHLHEVQPGDTYLLCSDGLSDMLDDDSIANLLNGNPALPEAAHALINAANDNGGRDNIALILARAEGRQRTEGRGWWPFGRRGGKDSLA